MFSQTAEYALRAAVCLAADPGRPFTTTEIARLAQVPAGYLAKVMRSLVRAGLVRSRRGKRGGFVLAGPPGDVTVLAVVSAVDPIRRLQGCPLGLPAHAGGFCPLHQRLDEAAVSVERVLGATPIADLLEGPAHSAPLGLLTATRRLHQGMPQANIAPSTSAPLGQGTHRGGTMTTAPGTRPRNPAFASLATYPFVRLDEAKATARAKGIRVIDFTIGDPHEETPSRIRERLLRSVPARSSYPPAAGTPALRAAIAGWCARRFGVQLDPEMHVLPSNGSKEAVYLIHQAVVDPRGERRVVLIPDPAYPVYEIATRFAGGEVVPVRLEPRLGFLPDLDALPADLLRRTALMWINYPNNPTGALADEGFFRRAVALAREHGFWLASDEAYSEIWFDAPPPGAISCGLENLIVFNTLSKRSAMTGYRSGFIAGDPEMIGLLRKVRPSQGVATPTFVMEAAIEAWGDEGHVADQRRIYREKREVLLPVLQRKGIELGGSEATFYLYFRVPGGESSGAFAARLLEHGIAVVPADFFGAGGEGWARMALVPTRAECEDAAAILERIL